MLQRQWPTATDGGDGGVGCDDGDESVVYSIGCGGFSYDGSDGVLAMIVVIDTMAVTATAAVM